MSKGLNQILAFKSRAKRLTFAFMITLTHWACASGGRGGSDVLGNENGSAPINENEGGEYKKAIIRCYKTGGTRVVKIMGTLKCY